MPRASTVSDPVVGPITGYGRDVHSEIAGGQKPSSEILLCSHSNVQYTLKRSHLERVGKKKGRTLIASTVETPAQTLRRVTHLEAAHSAPRRVPDTDRARRRD